MSQICHQLLGIIAMQSKSKEAVDTKTDWVRKANAMLPAEFGALFDGEPATRLQAISMDLKLLDAVFAMAQAPYARKRTRERK